MSNSNVNAIEKAIKKLSDSIILKDDENFNLKVEKAVNNFGLAHNKYNKNDFIALYDDTIFGKFDKGILFLSKKIIYKLSKNDHTVDLPYSEIHDINYDASNEIISFTNTNGKKSEIDFIFTFDEFELYKCLKEINKIFQKQETDEEAWNPDWGIIPVENKYLDTFNKLDEKLIKSFNIEIPRPIKDEIIDDSLKIQKLKKSGFLGIGKKESYEEAVEVYERSTKRFDNYKEKLIDVHKTLNQIKNQIAYELFYFSRGPILDIFGYFGKDSEIDAIYECCNLENYNFNIDYNPEYLDQNQLNDLKIGDNISSALNKINKVTSKTSRKLTKAYNSGDSSKIKLAKTESMVDGAVAAFEIGGQILGVVGNHLENLEKIENAFSQLLDSYSKILDGDAVLEKYFNEYKQIARSIGKTYEIYHKVKQTILLPKLSYIFNTEEFKQYLGKRQNIKENFLYCKDELDKYKKIEILKPNKIISLLSLGFVNIRYTSQKKKFNKEIVVLEKNLTTLAEELKEIEDEHIPIVKNTVAFKEYKKDIISSVKVIKQLRESLFVELSLENL